MIARQETIRLAIDAAKKQLHDYRMCKHDELARAYKTASKIEANKAQNENDSSVIKEMMRVPEPMMAEYFARNAHRIIDDSTYWNVLGTLWKLGGTVVQQELWITLFNAQRTRRHKIMKSRERRAWRRLPARVTAYRAVNNTNEANTAIAWTLSKKVAEHFAKHGSREIVAREFDKSEVIAYFDRRKEAEILVNL